ncbi:MAG: hypothetical protein M1501_01905 [Candidatus Omnitrophica bacterium]|nr:hypothetical protein [Candidatus Omnitrophota bacterium]
MRKERGQALITVLVFIAVFVAITFAVVIVATVSYKRATYSHSKLIAQELAETGIQDALYKLNYRYHDSTNFYGFCSGTEISLNPASGKSGSCLAISDNADTDTTETYTIPAALLDIPDATSADVANVSLYVYNDNTSFDSLVSVGTYKGTTVTISTNIRTISNYFPGPPPTGNLTLALNASTSTDTKGIPEAFNKHVIYANSVIGAGTVIGNTVCSTTSDTSILKSNNATLTETGISAPALSASSIPSLPGYLAPPPRSSGSPPTPSPLSGWDCFYASGSSTWYSTSGAWVSGLPSGVTYSDTTYSWTFTTYSHTNTKIYVESSGSPTQGNAIINGNFTSGLSYFIADGNITISSPVNMGDSIVLEPAINETPPPNGSLTINSDIIIIGDILVASPNTPNIVINGTLKGALISNNSIGIQGSGSINPSTSTIPSAILINNISGSTTSDTVILNSTPAITLGQNQISAIMAYSSSGGNVGVNVLTPSPLTLTYNNSGQSAIIAYTTGGGTGTAGITIGSSILGLQNGSPTGRLIYAYGNTGTNITLNSGTVVTGSLVTSGTVNLNGGTLTWDPNSYKMENNFVYQGFSGGTRVFVPENWKITW